MERRATVSDEKDKIALPSCTRTYVLEPPRLYTRLAESSHRGKRCEEGEQRALVSAMFTFQRLYEGLFQPGIQIIDETLEGTRKLTPHLEPRLLQNGQAKVGVLKCFRVALNLSDEIGVHPLLPLLVALLGAGLAVLVRRTGLLGAGLGDLLAVGLGLGTGLLAVGLGDLLAVGLSLGTGLLAVVLGIVRLGLPIATTLELNHCHGVLLSIGKQELGLQLRFGQLGHGDLLRGPLFVTPFCDWSEAIKDLVFTPPGTGVQRDALAEGRQTTSLLEVVQGERLALTDESFNLGVLILNWHRTFFFPCCCVTIEIETGNSLIPRLNLNMVGWTKENPASKTLI